MVSFLKLVDGIIVYDEYSTPARWSRVMLAHTTRIVWCCLFSYLISELRRGGLWPVLNLAATPEEAGSIICTVVDKTIPSTFLGEVDVCELYYWLARVFSRASHRCSSYNLSVGSLTWLTYALWDACQDDIAPGEYWLLQCACQFFWTGHFNSCMFTIN